MSAERKPLFGMIAYYGGWSVSFRGDKRGTVALSGAGAFPAERFQNIPIVDCRTVVSFKGFPDHPAEHYSPQWRAGKPTLAQFLTACAACGATITRSN